MAMANFVWKAGPILSSAGAVRTAVGVHQSIRGFPQALRGVGVSFARLQSIKFGAFVILLSMHCGLDYCCIHLTSGSDDAALSH
jgi:hypothetical protein